MLTLLSKLQERRIDVLRWNLSKLHRRPDIADNVPRSLCTTTAVLTVTIGSRFLITAARRPRASGPPQGRFGREGLPARLIFGLGSAIQRALSAWAGGTRPGGLREPFSWNYQVAADRASTGSRLRSQRSSSAVWITVRRPTLRAMRRPAVISLRNRVRPMRAAAAAIAQRYRMRRPTHRAPHAASQGWRVGAALIWIKKLVGAMAQQSANSMQFK